MQKTGSATTPLHGGHCPPWLFSRMKELSVVIVEAMLIEHDTEEVLRRFSDPVWFQAFGSVLGFDWHSSGLTTVVLGALKEGLAPREQELGLYIAGGKGRASRATPQEIDDKGSRFGLPVDVASLTYASKMAAKVDSALVQDGYQLYHHVMLFDRQGHWAIVQQGMNDINAMARRYHWRDHISDAFTKSPHTGIAGRAGTPVFDLTSAPNWGFHDISLELLAQPDEVLHQLSRIEEHPEGYRNLILPRSHPIPSSRRLDAILHTAYAMEPANYEALVGLPGVGASTMRALAMVAEVVYGAQPTFVDPVRYSFAHGGKDGYPFPVNRKDYDISTATLKQAIEQAHMQEKEKLAALKRLSYRNPNRVENL
ncbi:MAG: DUF763 domain-containing protein [Firmicutes bacterium]|nr:DUF763 domain-containing protein [Bacillota bacterium]